uniref:Uncharacterized protein n=1 Tax=Vibrio parahaemolyticus TaxID=670 RepID=B5UAD8_VIBPH|nr:hypothetical protein [Vibrio parahaemolyticus]
MRFFINIENYFCRFKQPLITCLYWYVVPDSTTHFVSMLLLARMETLLDYPFFKKRHCLNLEKIIIIL